MTKIKCWQPFLLSLLTLSLTLTVKGQMRVGAAGAAPREKTEQPTRLSVQNYAVIDISGNSVTDPVTNVELDDAGNAAFASVVIGEDGSGHVTSKTFKHGVLGDGASFSWQPKVGTWTQYYSFFLRVNGDVIGSYAIYQEPPKPCGWPDGDPWVPPIPTEYPLMRTDLFSANANGIGGFGSMYPYDNEWIPTDPCQTNPPPVYGIPGIRGVGQVSESGYLANFLYQRIHLGNSIYVVDPRGHLDHGECEDATVFDSKNGPVFFDPYYPGTNTASATFVKTSFRGIINAKGSMVGPDGWWDGSQIKASNLPVRASGGPLIDYWCLTEDDRMLVATQSDDPDGMLWEKGQATYFAYLLGGTAYAAQLSHINPLFMSNEDAITHDYNVVTALKDGGVDKLVLWKNTLPPKRSDGTQPPRRFELFEMKLPDGVNIPWWHYEVINSSGVIAAINDDGHALLFIPLELKQLNYPTTNGVTDLGPATEKFLSPGVEAGSVAYITGAPMMPQLEAKFAGVGQMAMTVNWSMDVISERPERKGQDDSHLPWISNHATVSLSIDQVWKLNDSFTGPLKAFGGLCTMHYTITNGTGNTVTAGSFPFVIRGKNPMDADALDYIRTHNGGRNYSWAIVQKESRQGVKVYNGFNSGGDGPAMLEQPNFTGPDGWGIAQLDQPLGKSCATQEVYDWHDNIAKFNLELDEKERFVNQMFAWFKAKYGSDPRWEEPPDTYQISKSKFSPKDLATIVLYNGAAGCPKTEKGAPLPRFPWSFDPKGKPKWKFTDNTNPVSGEHYATAVIKQEWEGGSPYRE